MSEQYLNLELRLLLLRYGKRRVIEGLASLENQTVEEVEEALANKGKKPPRPPKVKPVPVDPLAEAMAARPDAADIIKTLFIRFDNGMLFPKLKEVERFLDQANVTHGKLKSRKAATKQVLRGFTAMPLD